MHTGSQRHACASAAAAHRRSMRHTRAHLLRVLSVAPLCKPPRGVAFTRGQCGCHRETGTGVRQACRDWWSPVLTLLLAVSLAVTLAPKRGHQRGRRHGSATPSPAKSRSQTCQRAHITINHCSARRRITQSAERRRAHKLQPRTEPVKPCMSTCYTASPPPRAS